MALKIMPSTNTAVNLLNARQLKEAFAVCLQILEIDPNEVIALQVAGLSLLRIRATAQAKPYLERALKMQPRNVGFLLNYAVAAAEVGEWDDVGVLCKKVAALDPGNAINLNLTGCVTRQNLHFEESLEYFRQAIKIRPQFEEALTNLGTTLWM